MSRFSGWTEKDVNNLLVKKAIKKIDFKKVQKKAPINTEHIDKIVTALGVLGIDAVKEYKFLQKRNFKFDIAVPGEKIAIEYEGGTYTNGRHTRGKGYAKDCEKYNLAVLDGWKLLRYTVDIMKNDSWEYIIAVDVKSLIKQNSLKS